MMCLSISSNIIYIASHIQDHSYSKTTIIRNASLGRYNLIILLEPRQMPLKSPTDNRQDNYVDFPLGTKE